MAEVKPYMVDLSEASSYLNPYSNVVLLHELYQTRGYESDSTRIQHIILKQYVQGIGTKVDLDDSGMPVTYYPDQTAGLTSGLGETGVVKRVEQGLRDAVLQIQKQLTVNKLKIRSLTFDIFGFSRGAAAARHCANEITKPAQKETPNTDAIPAAGYLGELLSRNGDDMPENIEVRFVGLFDTVVRDTLEDAEMLKKIIDIGTITPPPYNILPAVAETLYEKKNMSIKNLNTNVMHIVARDERRENFPLTVSDSPNTHTLYLFGCHSGIGGGYANLKKETTYISYKDIKDGKEYIDYENMAQSYRLQYARSKNINTGKWEVSKEQIQIKKLGEHRAFCKYSEYKFSDHYAIVDVRTIPNHISLVAMNAMMQGARNHGVPFPDSAADSGVRNLRFFVLPDDAPEYLRNYYNGIDKMARNPGDDSHKPTWEEYYGLYQNYVHISSNFNSAIWTEEKATENRLYVNQPTEDGYRRYISPAESKE